MSCKVLGATRTLPAAVAVRCVSLLAETSTIFASPSSFICVSFAIMSEFVLHLRDLKGGVLQFQYHPEQFALVPEPANHENQFHHTEWSI